MGGNGQEKKTKYGLLRQDNNDGLYFGSGQVTFHITRAEEIISPFSHAFSSENTLFSVMGC